MHTRKVSDKAVGRPDAQGTFELAVTGHYVLQILGNCASRPMIAGEELAELDETLLRRFAGVAKMACDKQAW